jgi:hypothetical protein
VILNALFLKEPIMSSIQKARRARTRDVAYTYRMGAGFPGDLVTGMPSVVEPAKVNVANPPQLFGGGVFVDTATNSVRQPLAADTGLTKLYGIVVRPFPYQQQSGGMGASIGAGSPPTSGVIDVARSGQIMTKCTGTPTKNGPVYMWVAASAGNNVQGMFAAANSAGNTILISNAAFDGPPDASGNVKIRLWETI